MRWVQASVGANIRMIPTSDILFFRAEDKYTRVQTRVFEALIRKPIKELIDELDPDEFWQTTAPPWFASMRSSRSAATSAAVR
jgi:DNA-binding LytR/AlgR family response regulator